MDTAIVTGSAGLIGSEAVRFLADKGMRVIGIDNDMRNYFFGKDASTGWNRQRLESQVEHYTHVNSDIRDADAMKALFSDLSSDVRLIVHTAAQPSHDWAAREPITDFTVNAVGTLNLLEMTRQYCPDAVFIFTSTNKVYGDRLNTIELVEQETRWEPAADSPYLEHGIDESTSIDQSKHSLFGVSKAAADILVQEYGRYFGMKTGVFRGGCLTGPAHSGTQLHGFLAYLMKCAIEGTPYTIFGYKGKQVRDNIHSYDLVNMFWHFYNNPRCGEVYNVGGSRHSNCSMLEAIDQCSRIADKQMNWTYSPEARSGDHIWWISDVRKFQSHYPDWQYRYNLADIFTQLHAGLQERNPQG